jgi:peptidoglycan/LPS O-acetylase OafA/YrhL
MTASSEVDLDRLPVTKQGLESLPAGPIRSSSRLPELDGLRGVAILLVLVFHGFFDPHFSSRVLSRLTVIGRMTWSGVDLFFVLSGFLIGGILLDVRQSSNYFKTFYFRRAYRILPVYFVVLGLFSIRFLHSTAGPLGGFSATVIPWYAYFTFTQNIWMAALGSFGAATMVVTWSLAVEEQFYLTAPLVVRKVPAERLALVLLAVIAAAPVLRTIIYFWFAHGRIADYVLMPCRADALSCGMLCALLVRTPRWWNFLLAHRSTLKKTACALFASLVVLNWWGNDFDAPMVTLGYSWLALFYTSILLITVSDASVWMRWILRRSTLMWLGTVSYFTYLLHFPMIDAGRRALALRSSYSSDAVQLLGGWLGIGLTLVLAAISWKCLEKPLLRRGHTHRY